MRKSARALALAFCYIAAAKATDPAPRERSCHVDGVETPVTCVTLDVPRNYDDPAAGTIALTAALVPASTGRPAPDPLVILAGGPGQSATSIAGMLGPLLRNVRRERDVVLFDVRGTGLSEPLDCKADIEVVLPVGRPSPLSSLDAMRSTAVRCAAELGDRVRHHTDREIVEDLERFRGARGYAQLNLWGGSFGTRVAQHYVRAYGEHVRAVVLDAVTPVGTSVLVTGAHTPDAALAKLLNECTADAACATAFPDLRGELERLLAAARAAPLAAAAVDPITARSGIATLDHLALSNTLRVALYARASSEILPFAIDAAAQGNLAPLLGLYGAASADASVSLGMQFSTLCAEDWPMARDAGTAARTGGLMRDNYYEMFSQACGVWPQGALPPAMLEPFKSNVPALAISGDSDPVTPPELAEQALRQFSTSVHLVVPHGFHTNSHTPCVARVVASFLQDPATGGRDHAGAAATPALRFFTGPSS
jgi:pimeloyl-ACP methyl ester carboxylesterase